MSQRKKHVFGKRFLAQCEKALKARLRELRVGEGKPAVGACGGCSEEGDSAELESQGSLNLAVAEMRNDEVRELKAALQRIKEGTYGLCCAEESDDCDGYVPKERLVSNPAADCCIHCKRLEEKKQGSRVMQPVPRPV